MSQATHNWLVAAYEQGIPIHQIARELGINRVTVTAHLKRAGVELRPKGMTDTQIDEAVQDYQAGQTLAQIGERLGFNATTVLMALRARGVKTRDPHGRER